MRRQSADRRAVVFLDDARRHSFNQLAAQLRRNGHRVVRVTAARLTWWEWLIERVLYHRVVSLGGTAGLARLGMVLADENPVDLQTTEPVLAAMPASATLGLPEEISASLHSRQRLIDKFALGVSARERGVGVPDQIAAEGVSAGEAAGRLGLPLVVKSKVGAGGEGVRIASSVEEIEAARVALGPDPALVFYQQLVAGEELGYSAVVGSAGVLQDSIYRSIPGDGPALATRRQKQMVDDPELIKIGRDAVTLLELPGPVLNCDFIKDEQGRYWLLDVNLRVFGSMLACEIGNIRFAESYEHAVGLAAEAPVPTDAADGTVITLYADEMDDLAGAGQVRAAVRTLGTYVRVHGRSLGPRYFGYELLRRVVTQVTRRLVPASAAS